MNVFILDHSLALSAQYHVDRHVVKMPTEALQICSSALYLSRPNDYEAYKVLCTKPTHLNHPMVKWAAESMEAFAYVAEYGLAVAYEYTFRYSRTHATHTRLKFMREAVANKYSPNMLSAPLCIPEKYKLKTTAQIDNYRNYYLHGKNHIHRWTTRDIPYWIFTSRNGVSPTVGIGWHPIH